MNKKQRNVSALNREQIAYIKGCSILQSAVWRISHKELLNSFGNKLSNSVFLSAINTLMAAREKNRLNALRSALRKWFQIQKSLSDFYDKRRVLLKHLVANKDSKLKLLLSKFLHDWYGKCRVGDKDILEKYGALFKFLNLLKNKALYPTKRLFFNKFRKYVNTENKTALRGLVNIYGRLRREILRKKFNDWRRKVKQT